MPRRDYYINLDAETPDGGLVTSFYSAAPAAAPQFFRDETYATRFHFLRRNTDAGATGRPFVYVPTSGITGLSVGMGTIDAEPTGGTFTITGAGGGTTSALAYNASAATVQTAIRASLTGFGSATVTGDDGGPWTIDYGATGAQSNITATTTALTPSGSTAVITNIQDGNSSLDEKWQIRLVKALPLARSSGWTTPNTVSVSVSTVQSGSATANKVKRVTWNADAYAGGVYLSVTATTGSAETVGPISYNTSADEFEATLENHSVLVSGDVAVLKNGPGDYSITFMGTQKASNTPDVSTSSNTLQIPDYFEGTLSAATAGVDDLLASATTATATFEVEIQEAASQPAVAARRTDAKFNADLIRQTPGQSTSTQVFSTPDVVVNFSSVVTGETGGGSTKLDGVTTLSTLTTGYVLAYKSTTYGWRIYQLTSGTDAESSPDIIRPDDYASSTNERVWKLMCSTDYPIFGDLNTGVFSNATDELTLTAGGVDTFTATSTGTTTIGKVLYDKTITAGGTTGARTIDKITGSVNFAAGASSLVVTNNKVDANSFVFPVIMTNDSTLKSVQIVPTSGSFTIYANAAATGETKVAFFVTN